MQLVAQVDHLDRWQRATGDALGKPGQVQVTGVSAEKGLHPRRRASQDDRCVAQPAELEGHVDGVIARDPILLVGGGILLVDDHQAETREGGEHGAARADDDIGIAGANPSPFGGPLRLGEPGVDQRQTAGEATREAAHRLRGETDLGNQGKRLATGGQGGGDRRQIDLGLAAARDPVEQDATVTPAGDGREQGRGRLRLGR